MAHLIDKDAVLAEINKRLHQLTDAAFDSMIGRNLIEIRDFLDSLEVEEVDAWKTVDNINAPQADRNKIYCVFTKDRYILAKVINHPKDEELLQWKCTEFPHHRYDMCEGDKYMQIV